MIRPITIVCFLLACGSGLYLYQAKHRVQMLDRQIGETVHAMDVLREQTRVLHAEWTLQNDPQRLQALADQFLNLKTVQPGQFTSMADIDNKLPPVPPPAIPQPEPEQVPVAQAPETVPTDKPAQTVPPPPAPVASAPVATAPPKPAVVAVAPPRAPAPEHHSAPPPPPPPHPVVAEAPRPRPIPTVSHPLMAAAVAHPIAPAASFTGSSLGMARSSIALPQPTPASASQWVNNGNGGG